MFIDTHTHITCDNLEDYKKELLEAKKLKVEEIILVCTNEEEKKQALSLNLDFVKIAYGIYPSANKEVDTQALDDLKTAFQTNDFIALGEIGLDYYWFKDNKEIQKEMLIKQLQLADELNKPVIIHTRDSIGDTLEILKKHANKRKGIIHCYSGSLEMAKEFIKLGYYLSFGGVLTFKNAVHPKNSLKNIDLNYVLFETDAPYLTPVPNRGKVNKCAYVIDVYKYASELLEIDINTLKKQVYSNYLRLFYEEN